MLSPVLRSAHLLVATAALAACAAPPPSGFVGNGTCQSAIALEPGVQTRVEVFNQREGGLSCGAPLSSDGFSHYSITIPPRSRADIRAVELPPSDGTRRFYAIYYLEGCPATRCRNIAGNSPISSLNAASVFNDTDEPATGFIVPTGQSRNRDLSLEVRYLPSASVACRRATPLTLGGDPQQAIFDSAAALPEGCGTGNAAYFSVTVPPASIARIAVTNGVGTSSARVMDSCESIRCGANYQESPATLFAQNNTDRERQLIVELVGRPGTSARAAYIDNVVPASRCELARRLSFGDSITASTASATTTATCSPGAQPQLFYSVSIPARTRATLALRRTGGGHARAHVFQQCASAQCDAVAETVDESPTPFVIDNPTMTEVQRLVAVSAVSAQSEFSLSFLRANELPTNLDCGTFTLVQPGQSAAVDTALGGGAPVGCDTAEGAARYYNVIVQPQRRATLTLTRTGATDLRLRLYEDCAMGRCASSNATSAEAPITVELRNDGPLMRGFVFSVGAVGGPASVGAGTLSVSPEMPL